MIMGNLKTLEKQVTELEAKRRLAEENLAAQMAIPYERGYNNADITLDFCIWLQKRAEVLFK